MWIVIAIIVFVFVVGCLLIAKQFFFSNDIEAIYGSRLEGIEKVKVTKDTMKQMKESLTEHTDSVEVRLAGRIIYVDAYVKEGVGLDTAKTFGDTVLGLLSEEQKAYYDIQLLIGSKTDTSQYPLSGYKHHTRGAFTWVNNKAES